MPYIGNQANTNFSSIAKQVITGNGGTSYTLTTPVANANELEIFVNNVRQEPGIAYTVNGTALNMTGNVLASDDFYVVYQGKAVQTTVPPDGSVSDNKLANNIAFPTSVISTTQTANATGSTTLDLDAYQNFILTLTGAVTLANPTTGRVGQTGFIVFIQDATGGRVLSLGSNFETAEAAGITLSTAANATDLLPYTYVSSTRILLGKPQLAFS